MPKFMIVAASLVALVATALTTEAAQRPRQPQADGAACVIPPDPADQAQLDAIRQHAHRYRGLSVQPAPEAEDGELALQEWAADRLSRLDYVPAHRVEHFRWITQEMGLPITGWHGRILATAPAPDGNGIHLTLRVAPSAGIGTADHTLEHYLLSPDGSIRHLGSQGAQWRGVTTFN